ncbi:GNAT family N-acetyltransferase [Mucilaginibacter sp. OK098]|uniref:GNAT family N-acetyltransferase n=1 Tax=Mucilaginibacter sp. OK098 TaxID=1855297 RepID=UPI00091ED956|nr:GNAT family N-acetyltransferase [Mucilaginibacter sp. OK098]SHM53125.1 Ribosomal protein S18 acetylase RimI [Mucilaginibacter sp. OK098]
MIEIRKATSADHDQIWEIIHQVISKGDTYVFDPSSPKEKMLDFWCGEGKHTYVATIAGKVAGTFLLKDNQPDLGKHVANGAYMVSPDAAGLGIGRVMGEFSIEEARQLGYKAIQFNFVVKSNERAVRLWEKLGFQIIGEIPDAFDHQQNGLTNAYIMYQKL